jgi:CRISPR-associated protein Cas5h
MVDGAHAGPLTAVRLRWRARFGFFLRAEAPNVGLGYPVPPRTAVLGLCANVLGLPKDALATELDGARLALFGRCPATHWHACNLRKIKVMRFLPDGLSAKKPPPLLMSEETNTQRRQEWLFEPDFEVVAALPSPYHDEFAARVRAGTSHFTPCMGLSEMLASVEHLADETLLPLPEGIHRVASVVRSGDGAELAVETILSEQLRVLSLSMPRSVTADRNFSHGLYYLAPQGGTLPVRTGDAWQSSAGAVMFL